MVCHLYFPPRSCLFPALILTDFLLGWLLFGVVLGSPMFLAGATIGATAAFLVGFCI